CFAREFVCTRPAVRADRSHIERMVPIESAFPRLSLANRNSEGFDELPQGIGCLGVDRTAAADDERPLRSQEQLDQIGNALRLRERSSDMPYLLREELSGPFECFGLNIFRQRNCYGTGFRWVCQDPKRFRQAREQLLRSRYPIEEP